MPQSQTDPLRRPGAPTARHLERTVAALAALGALPAIAAALWLIWTGGFTPEVRWTLAAVILIVWIAAISAARGAVAHTLTVVASLLGALREGDYSIRGLNAPAGSAMALVVREVNDLGSTLQRQRTEALESTALLTHVMEEIVVAVFAFDPANRLLLVNRAGAVLVGQPREELAGRTAAALGFDAYLSGESPRLVDRMFDGRRGRYEVRRAQFYRDGRPHHLVVITDLSQALREEEQAAWQRIVRVLSHEINNSLTPIKSIAHSLKRRVERVGPAEPDGELRQGLSLIEERSGSLSRFIRSYAQLARLPKPQPRTIRIAPLVQRIVELENRLAVSIQPSIDLALTADSDQIEQLLINLVRNAVDASLETAGGVSIGWKRAGGWMELHVDDEGKGIAETSNLFVPFFTTKPNGSGIGLALSRQIAEAHRGTIGLENRVPGSGCRAILRLPLD